MATKKKASKKKTLAKKSTGKGLVVSWQQALADNAQKGKSPKEKALTGDYISIKGGRFSLGGVKIGLEGKGFELDCVVIAWIFEKAYYDTDYVEGETSAPACAALSYDEDELIPFEDAPAVQCDNCADCWANEWESGTGKGKACADRRRLALIVAGKNDEMELKLLNIPPTSLKNWKAYINDLDNMGIHPMQAACNISFDEDYTGSGLPPLIFEFMNEITSEKALNLTAGMLPEATKLIEQPYDFSNYGGGEKKGKKSKKKISKKKASKKKSKKRASKFQ